MSDPIRELETEIDDLLIQFDPLGRLRYVSPSAAGILGLSPASCEGKSLWEFVPPDDHDGLQAATLEHAAVHAPHWEQESKLKTSDGQTLQIRWVVWAHYDPAGNLDHLNAIGHDVTEQRLTERDLSERLSFEALILKLSTHFIGLAPQEVDAGIQAALQAIGEFAAIDRSYVFRVADDGRTISNTHEWCAPGIEPQLPKLQQLPVSRYPWWLAQLRRNRALHLPDVSALPSEAAHAKESLLMQGIQSLLAVPMTYGHRLVGFVGFDAVRAPKTWTDETVALLQIVATQITGVLHRKEAEEALRRTMASLAAAQRIAHIGHWEHDLLTGVSVWSDETYRLFGHEPRGVKPSLEAFEAAIHPDDRRRVHQSIRRAIDARLPISVDCRIRRPDGTIRVVHMQGEATYDEEGWPVATRGTLQDTTELRQAEAEVARREAELRQSREIDRLKTEFVGAVSHELRTPLSSIKGYAEFLADELSGPLNPDQQLYVHQIEEGVHRLERIINDLLDFARLEAGTFKLSLEEADLAAKVREIVASLHPQATRRQLELSTDLPGPLCLRMDPDRIGQVLLNLVGNALKFTRPGGRIEVTARRLPQEVRVEVHDTGIGIPPDRLQSVFQKFYQVDTSLTREAGGAGLGLSIAKALVEAHGGRIGVSSTPEVGTTFWFALPTSQP